MRWRFAGLGVLLALSMQLQAASVFPSLQLDSWTTADGHAGADDVPDSASHQSRGALGASPGSCVAASDGARILRLIATGQSSKEISEALLIHYRTVENHRVNIAQKLGLSGHNAVLKFALEHKTEV